MEVCAAVVPATLPSSFSGQSAKKKNKLQVQRKCLEENQEKPGR